MFTTFFKYVSLLTICNTTIAQPHNLAILKHYYVNKLIYYYLTLQLHVISSQVLFLLVNNLIFSVAAFISHFLICISKAFITAV
jgi:hypothetical protein